MFSIWTCLKIVCLQFRDSFFQTSHSYESLKVILLTLSQTTNLDSSKQKEFVDKNFKFDENGGKFSKRVHWLVVLGFNATLTAKVISWQSVMHMCLLALSHQY